MAGPRRLSNERRNLDQMRRRGLLYMNVEFLGELSWASIALYLIFSFLDLSERVDAVTMCSRMCEAFVLLTIVYNVIPSFALTIRIEMGSAWP